jgi:hypothetical protein
LLLSKTPTSLRCFFRLRHELAAGREAARLFWKTEVLREALLEDACGTTSRVNTLMEKAMG